MKGLQRLLCVSSGLTVAAVVAPIAWCALAFGVVVAGEADSSAGEVVASAVVLYGLLVIPFLAAPALVVLGAVLSVIALFVGRNRGAAGLAAGARQSLLVHVLCGLVWLGTLGVFSLFPD